MAQKLDKQADKTEERIVAVEEAFGKTEQFIEKNQKIILIVIGVIIVATLGFFGFKRFYIAPRQKEAEGQMFMAQKYFEQDSLKKALNGDGQYLGFLAIIDEYGMTKSANLSHYYAGMCYLKLGQFENAITQLKKFSADDKIIAPLAKGSLGDAYVETNDIKKGVGCYIEAAEMGKNEFISPYFLMRAAMGYTELSDFENALKMYKKVKDEYPRSNEGRDIERYITFAEGKIKEKK
ncbi:MAG: tetratricopeptide repeat protein [Bacteroidetes bacterium]|nr:tetratricopeptide repeat protein [Bacteroidota bacterium]